MKKTVHIFYLLTLAVLLLNCNKKEDEQAPQPPGPDKIAYLINEGAFLQGNGSITMLNLTNNQYSPDYFETVNGYKLGDIVQSMAEAAGNYYIVVNNSAKIEVVDRETFQSKMTISEMGSPRYFLAVNDTLALVTDLFNNTIHRINPESGSKYTGIPVNGWSENLEKVGDEIFVALPAANQVAVIGAADSDQVTDSIMLDLQPLKMVKDKNNKLWIYASIFQGDSKLYKIDPETRTIEGEWLFSQEVLLKLTIDPEGSNIYFATSNTGGNPKIFKMDVTAADLPSSELFTIEFSNIYGLDVDIEGKIYVCDAKDFVQQGELIIYDVQEQTKFTVPSGIIPNGVFFAE